MNTHQLCCTVVAEFIFFGIIAVEIVANNRRALALIDREGQMGIIGMDKIGD